MGWAAQGFCARVAGTGGQMRWSSVLASHEACVGGCSGAAGVSAREGVRDGVASIVWLEAKGKKKYSSQFCSWVVPAAIATAAGRLVCPREACESRCDGVAGVPAKGGGGDDAMLVVLLACSGSVYWKRGNGSKIRRGG